MNPRDTVAPQPATSSTPLEAVVPGGKVSRREFMQIFSAVMLPMFLAAVDQTLLATATPSIAADLGGLRDTSWIAIGYLLASTVMIPVYGRLGDRYGRRTMLLTALGVFFVGSMACGFAASLGLLIAARVLQGLGGGGLMVMAQALIGELVPPRERGRFQGYFAAVFTVASVSGPVLGGLVVTHANWRWLFWANGPLVAFALWRVSRLPKFARNEAAAVFEDLPGIVIYACACVVTLFWVTQTGHRFPWFSTDSLAFVAGAVVLWTALVRRERSHARAFMPVELLRQRTIAFTAMTIVCFASCMFALVFFLPVYMQLGHGVSPASAGLMILPLTFGIVTGSTTTGRLISKFGKPKWIPVAGMSIVSTALLLLSLLPPLLTVIAALGFFCGLGLGTVMPTSQVVIQTRAGRERLGVASATTSLARATGSALGTALFGALVFALLKGTDIQAAASLSDDTRAAVIAAFRHAFFAASVIAGLGAWLASRAEQTEM
jgi:EmrB/QacA subfamily drug resistance transporter